MSLTRAIAASLLAALLARPAAAVAIDAPATPVGVHGELSLYLGAFTLMWAPVDGAAAYNVYRRADLDAPAVRLNGAPVSVPAFADRSDGRVVYYSVRAVDAEGRESGESALVDSSREANVIFQDRATETTVFVPNTVSGVLSASGNRLHVPLTLAVRSEPATGADVLRGLSIAVVRTDTGETIDGADFPVADVRIRIGYRQVESNRIAALDDGRPGAGQPNLYWNNGFSWIRAGARPDAANLAVELRTAQLGRFELRLDPAAAATAAHPTVYPDVITPNGDGLNDTAFFTISDPAGGEGTVFDRLGHRVADLRTVSIAGAPTLAWDGRNDAGTPVPGDFYVVRLLQAGRPTMLTVAVAR